VVLQFLKENSLLNSFHTLSVETGVSLNTHSTPQILEAAVKAGEWDAVLREISTIEVKEALQVDLYEQIVLEMVDLHEVETARKILRNTLALRALQQTNPDRHSNMEAIAQRGVVDVWPNGSKKSNRKRLAKALLEEIAVVPPSRLLSLIGQALKFQRIAGHLPVGTAFNLFRGKVSHVLFDCCSVLFMFPISFQPPVAVREDELEPTLGLPPITFASGCRPTAMAFSYDGLWILTGSTDGFLEIWSW
jgi:WD40 repeat-containing protein SMU1